MAKMNRIQFQPGMSLSLFLAHYGTEVQCMAALEQDTLAGGVCVPVLRRNGALRGVARSGEDVPVQRVPPANDADRRNDLPRNQAPSS